LYNPFLSRLEVVTGSHEALRERDKRRVINSIFGVPTAVKNLGAALLVLNRIGFFTQLPVLLVFSS
jgi:hypothetical protein